MRDRKFVNNVLRELESDDNRDLLDKILSPEALDLLRVQEDEKDVDYSKFKTWKDNDSKATPTTSYGITKNGISTAGKYQEYANLKYSEFAMNHKPFYLEDKYIDKTWELLNDKNESPTLRNILARRIAQYHSVVNSAILDGYTNNKFSTDYNDVERQLTLLNYHTLNIAGSPDFENSMSTQAIRLNNHAMLAQSFIQEGTGEVKNYIKQGKVYDNASRRNLYNSRHFFSSQLPTPDEYLEYLAPIRDKKTLKNEVKKAYATLNNASARWNVMNDYELKTPKTDLTGYEVHSSRIPAKTDTSKHTTPINDFSSKNSKMAEAALQYPQDQANAQQFNDMQKANIGQFVGDILKNIGNGITSLFTSKQKISNINTGDEQND